ncbi:hypothetical protein QBC43DRAFT_334621 [Cladorrhinum sp. PSN259]|nr:hypothetical protein QBC43DRAFT_334621 [Cladorrhinum sp. PSN259]
MSSNEMPPKKQDYGRGGMATLIAWIKQAFPYRRRELVTEDKADAAKAKDMAEQVDKADVADLAGTDSAVEETPSLNDIQRATDVLVADKAAGRGKLPPQFAVSAGGRVDAGQQVEKDNEHHYRYSGQMPLGLQELESAGIDPLVAANMHNINHSPIYRLPDELLLQVLRCLGDDPLTVLCLRRVARRLRRIIDDPEIWNLIPRVKYLDRMSGQIVEQAHWFPKDLREELWRRIQKDGTCDKCRMLRPGAPNSPDAGWLQHPRECPAVSRFPLGLHCDGCSSGGDDAHPCLGRHGAQQEDSHDGQACLDGFSVECSDLSHDTRCSAEDAPTWPRASLEAEMNLHQTTEWVAVLVLQWQPHSGSDVFSLTPERRAPASEMRTLFQRHRQGAADIIFPSFSQLPFPEMACFADTECQCLHYEAGGNLRLSAAAPSKPTQRTLFSGRPWDFESHKDAGHIQTRLHGSLYKGEPWHRRGRHSRTGLVSRR